MVAFQLNERRKISSYVAAIIAKDLQLYVVRTPSSIKSSKATL